MKKIVALIIGLLLLSGNLFALTGCGCNDQSGDDFTGDTILLQYFDPTLPTGSIEFTNVIVDYQYFDNIIPLGQINPPGHTFPTDHIYFVTNGLERPVYAPCGGKILYIEESGMYGDGAVRIGVSNTMAYYLGHIFVEEDLQVGDTVEAGEQIGISGNTSCVDFGVVNKNIENGFLNEKTPITTLYGDKPLSYYTEPLRTQLYSLVKPPQLSQEPDYVYGEGVIHNAG